MLVFLLVLVSEMNMSARLLIEKKDLRRYRERNIYSYMASHSSNIIG